MGKRETAMRSRNAAVFTAAVAIADTYGLAGLTRPRVAALAGVSLGTVNSAYGTMRQLRNAVIFNAVQTGRLAIVAQGLAEGNETARNANSDLKARALATLS